jgi:hypothetical protein
MVRSRERGLHIGSEKQRREGAVSLGIFSAKGDLVADRLG